MARQLWRGAALTGIGLVGGAAIVTARHLLTTPKPLESGLPGEAHLDRRHGGEVYYTVAGPVDARPLVLLHGFYAGASSYEYRAVFARLAETNRVYAPDWLGFGMSERPALTHTGEFYANMLVGFLRDVVGAPAAVVAHGLAGNIAVRAASDAPALFDRLTLVAPEADAGMSLDPTLGQTLSRLFQKARLGITPYALMSTRPLLRLAAARRSAAGLRDIDDRTLDHLSASAHQFGAEHAALSLYSGELDLPIRPLFPRLQTPTLIMIGARDNRHSLPEMERLVSLNPNADLEMVSNAGETVYLDQPTLFMHTLHRWLGRRVARQYPVRAAVTAAQASAPSDAPVASPTVAPPAPVAPVAPVATMPAVKIVPVLEPTPTPPPTTTGAPLEIRVTRTPDGEAIENTPGPSDAAQALSLEPTTGREPPSARISASNGVRAEKTAPRPPSATLRQAREKGAHVARADTSQRAERGGGRGSHTSQSSRRRHAR